MNLQSEFDNTVHLLENNKNRNFVNEVLSILSQELTYWTFSEKSEGTARQHLLDVYEHRYKMHQKLDLEQKLLGWEDLLPAFRETHHDHICVNMISSNSASYLIFCDFNRSDLVGILKSPVTLSENREKLQAHKLQGFNVSHHAENVFIDRRLRTR